MKKRFFKSISIFLAITVIIPCLPAFALAADTSQDIREYTLLPKDSSPYGHVNFDIVDEFGNTVDANSLTSPARRGEQAQEALPSSYSSVSLGRVTPIKNQGYFGSCWAMAAVACAESAQLTKGAGTFDYSEDHLLWFRGKRSTSPGDGVDMSSNINDDYSSYNYGGSWGYSTGVLSTWTGLVPESTAPYGTGGYAESERYQSSLYLTGAELLAEDSQEVRANADVIKQFIIDNGAVDISYYHDDANFGSSGTSEYSYFQNSSTYSNHEVVIVGWDDNYARTNFVAAHRPSSNGAWLIKNSHGTYWYDDGYMWLSYYDTSLSDAVGFTYTDTGSYAKNYQYDGFYSSSYLWIDGYNTMKMANVFCADADEKLGAVAFWTQNNNVSYTVKIYVSNFKMRGGTLAATQTGTLSNSGYHTVELSSPVSVADGKYFTAEVTLTTPEDENAYLTFEGGNYSMESAEVIYTSNAGESYFLNPSSGQWLDASSRGYNNAAIKVFTVEENYTLSLESDSAVLTLGGAGRTMDIDVGIDNASLTDSSFSVSSEVSDSAVASAGLTRLSNNAYSLTITALSAGTCTVTLKLYRNSTELLDTKTISVKVPLSGMCGDNLLWVFDSSTGELSITGTGDMYDYEYEGLPWFNILDDIYSVTIGNGVTRIGNNAFCSCLNLSSVTVSDTVTAIGRGAFQACVSLGSVTLGNGLRTIEPFAFMCSGLTSITLPESLTSIGDSSMASMVFYGCNLSSIHIPKNVSYIDSVSLVCGMDMDYATGDGEINGNFTQITVDGANMYYSSQDGVLYNKDKTSLIACPTGKTGTLTILPSVTQINQYALTSCSLLTHIAVDGANTAFSSVDGVLFSADMTTLVAYPQANTATGYSIPVGVTSIGNVTSDSFFNCKNLTSVEIPQGVEQIADNAFEGCTGLNSIIIPNSVTSINSLAFFGCAALKSITVLSRTATIGDWAFGIADDEGTLVDGVTIYCYDNSTAKTYAIDNGIDYVLLKDTVLLTFDANGGTFFGNDTTVVSCAGGEKVSFPSTEPMRDGYVLAGYFTQPTGGEQVTAADRCADDITYYAQWQPAHTVIFKGKFGDVISSKRIAIGADIVAPSSPADIVGYKFSHWEADGVEVTDVNADVYKNSSSDIVFLGQYTENTDNLFTVVVNGEIRQYEQYATATVTAPASSGGMSFSYWEDSDGRIVSSYNPYTFRVHCDMILEAVYTIDTMADPASLRVTSKEYSQYYNTISFYAERSIFDRCTVLQHGIIITDDSTIGESWDTFRLDDGTPVGVQKSTALGTDNTGLYILTFDGLSDYGETIYARSYAKFVENGHIYYAYSSITAIANPESESAQQTGSAQGRTFAGIELDAEQPEQLQPGQQTLWQRIIAIILRILELFKGVDRAFYQKR